MVMWMVMVMMLMSNLSFKLWNAGRLLVKPTHDCVRGPPSTVILLNNNYLRYNHKNIIIAKIMIYLTYGVLLGDNNYLG